jgi:hypothetical protein
MTFSVIYDSENINLDLENIDSQTNYKIISDNE